MVEFNDRRSNGERNFEVSGSRFFVGGQPFPAKVRQSTSSPRLHFIQIPTESGWNVHAHMFKDLQGNHIGNDVLGEMTVIHHPTLDDAIARGGGEHFGFHRFPDDMPNTKLNTSHARVLKTVHNPEEFHDFMKYVNQIPGGSESMIPK